jgi:hypothetical protein
MRNLFNFKIIVPILVSVVLFSCKTAQVSTQKPEENYTAYEYKPTQSTINLPFTIKSEAIEKMINSKLTGLLYEDNNIDDDNLMTKVWKKGDVKLKIQGTTIDYDIPLKIWAKVGVRTFGTLLSKEMDLEIILRYRTVLTIAQDWSISTKTTPLNYDWITAPQLDFGFIKIPVQTMANLILIGTQGIISREIDNQVKQNLLIKQSILQAWTLLQKPYLLDNEYKLWLKMTPNQILMSPIKSENGYISSIIGIKSTTEVFVSQQTPKYVENKKLPNFSVAPTVDNNFSISMGIDVPYTEAEEMAKKSIVGQTFTQGKRTVKVTGLKIYGSNNKMVISTQISGSINGTIYLTGIPYYNAVNSSIELKDAQFDIETKNVLAKSANWLFHSGIEKKIKESMVFSIAPELDKARKTINQNLNNTEIVKGVLLNGKMSAMDIKEIILAQQSIKIVGFATGNISVLIDALDM